MTSFDIKKSVSVNYKIKIYIVAEYKNKRKQEKLSILHNEKLVR